MPIKENRKNAKISIVLYCIPGMDTRFVRQNNSTYWKYFSIFAEKSQV